VLHFESSNLINWFSVKSEEMFIAKYTRISWRN